MPIITNFGDVVTVGNAAVNGTGTSSFAGPVTFAQGVSITGAVSTSSAFYGVLAGANTAAVSALTASTNVYAPIVTTPVSNAATAIATTGFYGALVGQNVASVTVLTASSNINTPSANIVTLNVSTQANVTFLNVSSTAFLSNANIITANIWSANVTTGNVTTLNVSGLATLFQSNLATANITSLNVSTQANVTYLNVSSSAFLSNANVLTANVTSLNVSTQANVTYLNVSSSAFLSNANVLTANVTSLNVSTQANVTFLNVSSTAYLSSANIITGNIATANIASLNVTGDANVANVTVRSNLYASNIIMSSNLSTNTGYGNVYLTGNLVVQGNIFSLGGSVGSGSGTSQGILYSLASPYSLGSSFATGSAGPGIAGYHINLSPTYFNPEATQSVSAFSAGTGMLKFATGGLYQVTCVIVGDQPIVKLAFGKTSSSSFAALPTSAISGYDYVYNFPVGSSPSTVITIPLTVQDTSQYYYLDVFFSTAAGTPSVLYPTRSTTAVGSAYGTYVQVGPFGNYLTSATGVASGLLMNAYGTTTLSAPVTSNTFRLAMTSSNGWTVNGVSTALAVTSGGNFQVSQVGIYEVSMCLNTSVTPMMFGVGSLAADAAPLAQGPYIYQYAPMYTQDPTTIVTMPLNITDTSKYYYLDVIFPGTQSTVALSNVSTFVSLKPVGSYVSPSTNPWSQQGTSVYYQGGAVGIGGVNPSLLTETLTVNGNTSFVGNVTVTSDVSGSAYVSGKRVPTGSLDVTQYVTGRVPLTTTTNLIQNYLSNAAAVSATGVGGYGPALSLPKTATSYSNLTPFHSAHVNTTSSNIFVEAWVYITANTGATQGIFSVSNVASDESGLYINSTGQIVAYETNSTGTAVSAVSATNLINGTWTHIAFSFNATGASKVVTVFKNGTAASSGALSGTTRYNTTHSVYIGGSAFTGWEFGGYIYDMRVLAGSIVPTASFTGTVPTSPAAFGLSAPAYVTGMSTGGSSNVALSLATQYFPGASTSPYGPCLTLPGTVGSYYSAANSAYDTNWKTNGFCLEAWVNYASFANSNNYNTSSYPYMIGHMFISGAGNLDWSFGPTTTGQISMYWNTGAAAQALVSANTITTGQWTHLMVQCNGSNVYMAINGTLTTLSGTGQNYSPAGGNGTIAPSAPPTVSITSGCPLSVGNYYNNPCPNFAIAKARLTFGTAGSPSLGNVYSGGTFSPSPNFATVPSGATVAWQLESQFPLPTYPSIQDVTQLPAQTSSFGSLPAPVGGVTSNVLGPLTSSPQLDSIRFDGTGYIDYGNAASSVLTANLWASPWTIEGWVYATSVPCQLFERSNLASGFDFSSNVNASGQVNFYYGASTVGPTLATVPVNTWTHVAVTYDGVRSNIYVSSNTIGTANISTTVTGTQAFVPTYSTHFGYNSVAGNYLNGNLADVRVSNVARYSGTTYVVPSAPFSTDSSTLLLLKSLAGQVGTTFEVQGRGLGSTSIGATQTVRTYPPAPMSSYLLDTTSNASVTYGQGKYVASASSENLYGNYAYNAFLKIPSTSTNWVGLGSYSTSSPYTYTGTVVTVDTLGNAYPGDWLQIQLPVSILLSSYLIAPNAPGNQSPSKFVVLGSRDGINWTLVDSRSGASSYTIGSYTTFTVQATQSYNYYRLSTSALTGTGGTAGFVSWTLNGTEESLCVTNDAKVGVGIANPQRALEVAGDLVVSGTISGGAGLGAFRNRIINGDMRINQRGATSVPLLITASPTQFIVDRWTMTTSAATGFFTASVVTLTASDSPYFQGLRNSIRTTATVGNSVVYIYPIYQIIEGYNIQDFNWGTSQGAPVTVSFWFRSGMPAGSTTSMSIRNVNASSTMWLYNTSFITAGSGVWQYVTITVPPAPNGSTWNTTSSGGIELFISAYNVGTVLGWSQNSTTGYNGQYPWWTQAGNYIEFTGVQLEKGTVATPWDVRPYATELALCQRYYVRFTGDGSYKSLGVASAQSSTSATGIIVAPTSMRAQPSIIDISSSSNTCAYTSSMIQGTTTHTTNDVYLYSAGVNFGFTTIGGTGNGVASPSYNLIGINLTNGSGITTGWSGMMYLPTGKYIGFSAEL
jgi:hypothetical protein